MQNKRDISFDAFRGLAIIAVVAIHATTSAAISWRNTETNEWNLFFLVAYRQLFLFAVPVFLFISGYWLSQKPVDSLGDYKAFLIRRLSRILIPYFFWSLVMLGYVAFKTHHISLYQIMFKLSTGSASRPYYFILLIAQFYALTPLLQYINRKPYGLILVAIFNIISLMVLYLSELYDIIGHLPVLRAFYSWIIFYEIGLLAGSGDNKILTKKKVGRFVLPAMLIFLLLSELESMILLLRYENLPFAGSQIKCSSFLYSICIILGFLYLRKHVKNWPRFLVIIGNFSFGIFLIHLPVLKIVAGVIQKNNFVYTFQPLYQFIIVLLTISICCFLISVARKLLPKTFCRRVLGF